jgi:phosphoglycolate phosphatase-like HAD superfamily hydrolase
LVDNAARESSRDNISREWSLINKQIFLGVLGSSPIPRKEIEKLLEVFGEAGVRFVYFSPRNMRRTKELASQMGIDVAWNCAISLRALGEGEDDPHRMTSHYADWDVNAKLPHGIDAVRKHLKEVDNVPLLVSLFTDATKGTTADMVR